MGVKLRERVNETGVIALRLDIIYKGKRTVETLPYKLISKPRTPVDREQNKINKRLAEQARANKEAEIFEQGRITKQAKYKTGIVEWMLKYCDAYTKKDKRNMYGATKRFAEFLKEESLIGLAFGKLTEEMVQYFWEYLKATCTGEGDRSYFMRFKKMMKAAYKKEMMQKNVATEVMAKGGGIARKKDVLSLQEVELLAATPIQNNQVKRAFLFCCFTGLRWCDVKKLCWKDIDIAAKNMAVLQGKTNVYAYVPLNDVAVSLLGRKDDSKAFIFDLPTANGANKSVKAWVKRAGITKTITWHNGRHTMGTNLIFRGANVLTASKLLGHTSLKHTMRYIDSADELKRTAVDTLNIKLEPTLDWLARIETT